MVNGLHLYSAFIQSAVQFMPLIHPFTHTFTHQRRSAAMQGTNQLVRSNWGLGVSLRDTSTRPGWDRTGNPPTARRQLLPPEPHRPTEKNGIELYSRKGSWRHRAPRGPDLSIPICGVLASPGAVSACVRRTPLRGSPSQRMYSRLGVLLELTRVHAEEFASEISAQGRFAARK